MAFETAESWMQGIPDASMSSLPYLIAALMLATLLYSSSSPATPLLNPRRRLELTNFRPKQEYVTGAGSMMKSWFNANPDKPARIISDFGTMTLLPGDLTNEIRNDDRFSFSKWSYKAFHAHLPGFEGFREGSRDSQLIQRVIIKDLTKLLNKVTEPLARETALVLPGLLGESQEWHTIPFKDTMLQLIARISSRVFLGEELCRSKDWNNVTMWYTVDVFQAAEKLRLWPTSLRPIVHWFLPSCRIARAHVQKAREIFDPVIAKRRQQKLEGKTGFDDAIEWLEREAQGADYDPVVAQLLLSMAAIHTTTDLTCQVLIQLAQNPEVLAPLRAEISTVLRENGWKKTSLYNMKLLDSVIKESQRVKPIGMVAMRRVTLTDVTLSDGTFLPKNSLLAIPALKMMDPEIYENPEEWDPHRFLKMRETPGKESSAQLVATSPEHLGFGHGKHACPGRFFAANEVKVALIHLLMNYDWRLPENAVPKTRVYGFNMNTDPVLEMEVRRREDESVVRLD